jgi:hypothetical protein
LMSTSLNGHNRFSIPIIVYGHVTINEQIESIYNKWGIIITDILHHGPIGRGFFFVLSHCRTHKCVYFHSIKILNNFFLLCSQLRYQKHIT